MTKRFLNSTTAALAALSLAMPLPVMAQSGGEGGLPICVNANGKPWKALPKGEQGAAARPAQPAPGAATADCTIKAGDQQLVFTGVVNDAGEVVVRKGELLAAMFDKGLGGDSAAAAGARVVPEAIQEPAQDTTVETAQDGTRKADADQPAAQAAAEAEPKPEEATEAAPATQAETEAQQERTVAKSPSQQAEAESSGRAETTRPPEAPAQTATADEPARAPSGEGADPVVEGRDNTQAEAQAEPESDAQAAEQQEVEVRQEDTAASTEAANATVETEAAAATAEESQAGAGEVETRTVTEADTRSSDQDFSTSAAAQAGAKKEGLSDFEKFAIGALGAVAVGAILNNGNKVVSNSGDRVVVQRQDGQYEVLKDDNVLLRRPGAEITTRRFDDGSSRETVLRSDGTKVVTIKAANGQVLRRVRVLPDGREIVLFDDTARIEPVTLSDLPTARKRAISAQDVTADELRLALAAQERADFDRRFSLQQIRQIRAVRELVPEIELEAVTFDTGSAAIRASEAEELRDLGVTMRRMIDRNPYEVFLVEGHTDAVGSATYNLALSDRRAESVALALTEYFDVPPENMVVQGYGEANLKIRTPFAERENRRATVRRITQLLRGASLQ